jgi:hypothetical protein
MDFVSTELGFKSEKQCRKFMEKYTAMEDEEDTETVNHINIFTSDDQCLDSKAAFQVFATAAANFTRVDIKGQI